MREVLKEFIKAIETEKFSEAHEIMEKRWKEAKKQDHPLTKLLKGFINGATAFELVKRGNLDGAKRLWGVYEKYLPIMTEEIEEYELFKEATEMLKVLKNERID